LKGRLVINAELVRFWTHKRDVVAAAYRSAFSEAGERLAAHPALVAAARDHLARLHQRETFIAEGGEALTAALNRFTDCAGRLRAGRAEADEIEAQAERALAETRSAPLEALLEAEHGPTGALTAHQLASALTSAASGMPFDADTGPARRDDAGGGQRVKVSSWPWHTTERPGERLRPPPRFAPHGTVAAWRAKRNDQLLRAFAVSSLRSRRPPHTSGVPRGR
jgi:hypothetical protein